MSTSLEQIAYQNGLELIETTSERTGYPANLRHAIIGFETFEEAEKIADENNLSIEIFTKRDGWQLYYRTGNSAHEPFKNSADNYGDDYHGFTTEDIDTFYEEEVKPRVEEFDDFDSLSSFIEKKKEIFEKLKDLNIFVRYFAQPGIDNYLRITIGTDEQMDKLISALSEIVG